MSECRAPHLHAEYAEDDEERAADEDDVADGPERREQGLDHQLQARGAVDHSAGKHY